MIRLKNFALRNAVAFVALFVCLGGTATAAATLVDGANIKRGTITSEQVKERSLRGGDIAKGAVTQKTVKNETLLSQDIRDGHVLSRDVKNGGIREEDLSPELRATVTRGADGARGAQGEQGPAGDGAGETGSAGGFLVKDADGTTAGPLLNLADTANLTFDFRGMRLSPTPSPARWRWIAWRSSTARPGAPGPSTRRPTGRGRRRSAPRSAATPASTRMARS